MTVVSEETIIKGLLVAHVGVSTVSSSLATMYAYSIYLFATALLLFAAVLLFIAHWRHQVVKAKKKLARDNVDSPDSPLTQNPYQNCELRRYEKFQEKLSSMESLRGYNRYSQYDNFMSNDYKNYYEAEFSKKTELV